jgi:predicted Zn-dependent protease
MVRLLYRLLKRQPIFRVTFFCLCIFSIGLTVRWLPLSSADGQPALGIESTPTPIPFLAVSADQLPLPAVHPLPPTLAQWQDTENQGDYFDAIEPTAAGYLIWANFPVQVYVQPPDATDLSGRSQAWYDAVRLAVQEWTVYLPLAEVLNAETADISIWRSAPPIQALAPATEPNQPLIDRLPRVRAAETRYEIFVCSDSRPILSHRYTIHLSPNQAAFYTQATARHELGHALGIWGHSPLQTDALYFSQVRNSPAISRRDINTLKRIYEQPTRLGWELRQASF